MEIAKIPFLGFSEPVSSVSHLAAAVFFLVAGVVVTIRGRGNLTRVSALVLYFTGNVFLFSMSGVYHLLEKGSTANYVLRVLDHAGIYILIAGSFTPFQIILLRGWRRWTPLLIIWILSIVGVVLTSVFFEDMPEALSLSLYIGMGWLGGITVWFIKRFDMKTVGLIALGGVFYTLGAVMDFLRWPQLIDGVLGYHEVFHFWIVAAALTHLYAIHRISHLPISDSLTIVIKKFPNKLIAYPKSENAVLVAFSEDEIKNKIKIWIEASFHHKLKPKRVRIRYHHEDHIKLD